MSPAPWLVNYFGTYYLKSLQPELFLDGKEHAIVKIGGGDYILVTKAGKLGATSHTQLFTGQPTPQDLEKMREALTKADG